MSIRIRSTRATYTYTYAYARDPRYCDRTMRKILRTYRYTFIMPCGLMRTMANLINDTEEDVSIAYVPMRIGKLGLPNGWPDDRIDTSD